MANQTDDTGIKLVLRSSDDVTMLSAFLQDGLVSHQDIHFDKARSEVLMVIDRYRWEQDAERRERVLMGLRIGKVSAMRQKKMAGADPLNKAPSFYNLLNLAYEQGQDGSKSLNFIFSGGAALQIAIDDLMMSAGDIAPPRPAMARPDHDDKQDSNDKSKD